MFGFKKWKRQRIGQKPFPESWLKMIEDHVPYYMRLPTEDRKELQRHILVFLSEKRFEGCGGQTITDEIRVTIAAQACILLLHRKTDYYPGLTSILVYPRAYLVPTTEHLPGGIVTEGVDVREGESWESGAVVLSWDDIKHGAAGMHDGINVVLHEFAHQLDKGRSGADHAVFGSHDRYLAWAGVFQKEYEKLCEQVSQDCPTFLDEYGATDPAEFFAVATEYFFEKSRELRQFHPELYQELKFYYQQDPAEL